MNRRSPILCLLAALPLCMAAKQAQQTATRGADSHATLARALPSGTGFEPIFSIQRARVAEGAPAQRAGRARIDVPPGRQPVPRPSYARLPESSPLASPVALAHCDHVPTLSDWRNREYEVMSSLQAASARSFLPVRPFPADQSSLDGVDLVGTNWTAYGFLVPAGGKVLVQLQHPKSAWFRIYWADQWGEYKPGMLIKPGEPSALYINPSKQTIAVYAIVDDSGGWATQAAPYRLTVSRNFDAAQMASEAGASIHSGIWNLAPMDAAIGSGQP